MNPVINMWVGVGVGVWWGFYYLLVKHKNHHVLIMLLMRVQVSCTDPDTAKLPD